MLLGFEWPSPHLSDVNAELIATYRGIRDDPEAIRQRLRRLAVDRETYDRVRRSAPRTDVGHAARLLYLNRCSYGGIYRTDKNGTYNVPFSGDRTTESLWRNGRLQAMSEALEDVAISCQDFADALAAVTAGSLVYCDPVYSLPDQPGIFRRYSARAFSWNDQMRLAEVAHELSRQGALVVISNTSDPRVARLYRGSPSMNFSRRVPLPKADGAALQESVYFLVGRSERRTLQRLLAAIA
jgi:DNA adenine methylase